MKTELLQVQKEIADLKFELIRVLQSIYKQNVELVRQIKELKIKLKEKK